MRSSLFQLYNTTKKCLAEGVLGKVRVWTHQVDHLKFQPMRQQEGPSASPKEQTHSFNSRHESTAMKAHTRTHARTTVAHIQQVGGSETSERSSKNSSSLPTGRKKTDQWDSDDQLM